MEPNYASSNRDLLFERMQHKFGCEEAAKLSFRQILWPNGMTCRKCRHKEFTPIKTRDLYECRRCKAQQSLTAGTPLNATRMPLTTWAAILFCHTNPHLAPLRHVARRFNVSRAQIYRLEDQLKNPTPDLNRLVGAFTRYLHGYF